MSDREKYVVWLVGKGFGEEKAWEFLWLLQAPISFGGYYQIMDCLVKVIPHLSRFEIVKNNIKSIDIEMWEKIAEISMDSEDELVELLGEKVSVEPHIDDITPVTYGQLTKFPIASAMYDHVEVSALEDMYIEIIAIVLCCQIHLLRSSDEFSIGNYMIHDGEKCFIGSISSCLIKIGKVLRELSYEDRKVYLEQLSAEGVNSIYEYYEDILIRESEDPENELMIQMRVYLDRTINNISPIERDKSKEINELKKNGRDKGARRYGFRKVQDSSDSKLGNYIYCGKYKMSDELRKECRAAGLTFDELFEELYEQSDHVFLTDCEASTPASAQRERTVSEQRHIGINNNHLITDCSRMSLTNLSVIINDLLIKAGWLLDKVKRGGKFTSDDLVDFESVCKLLVIFATGSSLGRANNAVFLKESNTQISEVAYLHDKKVWRIKVKFEGKRASGSKKGNKYVEKKTSYLYLPDVYGIGRFLEQLQKMHLSVLKMDKMTSKKRIKIFKCSNKKISKAAREIIKGIDLEGV